MSDYVVKKEFGRRPGTILRFLGELEWVERSYARTFALGEAQALANEHGGQVARA